MDRERFRRNLTNGIPQVGMFVQSNEPAIVEVAALAGFDFVCVDIEHGSVYYNCVENMCRAAQAADIDIIVRIPFVTPNNVFRPLDSGATGVQAPQVNDPDTARIVVSNTKYAPEGCRGGARPRASMWGTRPDYFAQANRETAAIIHCETKEAVENIDAILSVPGIDVVFGGPQDLSHSYGIPGDTANPIVQNAISTMREAAVKHGVVPGVFVNNPEDARKRIEQGFKYMLFTNDQSMLLTYLKTVINAVGIKK